MAEARAKKSFFSALTGTATDWIVPIAAVSVIFVMLVPLPALVLDFLLAISITASVLVLMSAIHILRPVQFSVFPSLLLLLTLFRLSLNLASSRRILLHGNEGASAAGGVIEAFGQFVVGGNYVVGFVLFLALIAIQFMVVSHGAVRTAEVTARFTLDAMPGKQMAIDADLNAGIIDEAQARTRREQVSREAEFYGAMDGAARFNQRDALATILITAINIVAGFLIGVFQLDIPFRDALKTYTILTVGDGLVTMIPSLLVSVSGGIVVTRASSDSSLGSDLGTQLLSKKLPLWIAAGVLVVLALIPGMPKVTFGILATALMLLARRLKEQAELGSAPAADHAGKQGTASGTALTPEPLEAALKLDDLSLEVGYGLVPLVDAKQGGQLLQRVRALRRHLAVQLGFIVPSVHITDNLRLNQREYVIFLRGVEIARWELRGECMLAISSEMSAPKIPGVDTREPAFGAAAKWIDAAHQEQALAAGYAVVDQTSVMATHLAEVIRQHAHELLSRQEAKRLLDKLGESHPKLIEELVPKLLTLGEVQKVLQQLLREQVSIRDLGTILESLIETASATKHPVLLVESARQALGRALVRPLLTEDGGLKVVTIDPSIEDELARAFSPQASVSVATSLQPSFIRRVLDGLRSLIGEQVTMATPVLLCNTPARFHLKRLLEPFLPKVVVLSPGEIPPITAVQSIGMVR
ncbi:MAG TPA: flagellar biosynthesis protein FlhA [Terriglobales bacterium]|nr:flagellar biosynthesis protein FlhA [Terriglobales bacterium]